MWGKCRDSNRDTQPTSECGSLNLENSVCLFSSEKEEILPPPFWLINSRDLFIKFYLLGMQYTIIQQTGYLHSRILPSKFRLRDKRSGNDLQLRSMNSKNEQNKLFYYINTIGYGRNLIPGQVSFKNINVGLGFYLLLHLQGSRIFMGLSTIIKHSLWNIEYNKI